MYQIEISVSTQKVINQLERKIRFRVLRRIESLAFNPRPHGVIKLQGVSNGYRIRSGDYRILYEIQDDQLLVLIVKVAHRRESYR